MELITTWLWLVFIIFGIFLVTVEVVIGVDTGYDLVFIGSAFVVGGLIGLPFGSWVFTVIITTVVCAGYLVLGRKYVTRWRLTKESKTNVDAIISKKGIVIETIAMNSTGRVQVGGEQWRARSDEPLSQGEGIVVTGIQGVTLTVAKDKGG